ncbi:MAG: TIR domain-containing protein [Leptolyngbyaceae cyanobacterium]
MTDVFISYSRKDKAFVQVLNQALEESKYDAWIDWENIPLTADWWEEIKAGIEAADTFIFVLSPDSIASKVCGQEIDHAVKHHKRLVPIVHREGFDVSLVRPALGKANWLFFKEDTNFDTAFHSLVKTLNTDLAHVKEHTRALLKALEWQKKDRSEDLLLRGRELLWAERWSEEAVAYHKQPLMTALQSEFIAASAALHDQNLQREAQRRRLKGWLQTGTAITVLLGMGISGALSLRNGQRAVNDVASQLRRELSGRIEDNIIQQIRLPNLINQINADAVRRGELTTQSLASENYLWQQMQYLDAVSWMYYASAADGSLVGISRTPEGNLQAAINDTTSDFSRYYYDLDNQGQRAALDRVNQVAYDARARTWFLAAVEADEPIWTNPYIDSGRGELNFSAATPVYDADGDLLGVTALDYSFNDLSTFLETLEIGKTGEAFIMDSAGFLIATSTGEALYRVIENNEFDRIAATNSEDNLTRAIAQIIDQRLDLATFTDQVQLNAVIDGEAQFVQVSRFAEQPGIDWLIVVVVPEADFLEDIDRNSRTTLLLMVLATGLTIFTVVVAYQLSEKSA